MDTHNSNSQKSRPRFDIAVVIVLALIALVLAAKAFGQDVPIGPISGGGQNGGTVTGFSFSNSLELTGTVTNPSTAPQLSIAINPGTIMAAKLGLSAGQLLLGRSAGGSGQASELTIAAVLDWLGSARGSIMYRGSLGWTTLSPSAGILTSGGSGTDPFWATDTNEKVANKGASNGYAGLDSGGKVPVGQLPGIELVANKSVANGYAGLNGSSVVPFAQLGSGGIGSGTKILYDNGTWGGISSASGGTVTSIGLAMPTQFTITGTNPNTTAGTFTVAWNNQAAYSWFGNATGSSAAPVFNTSQIPSQLMPAMTGDVTTSAGSTVATIPSNQITYAKFQQVGAASLVGNPNGSTGNATAVTIEGGQFVGSVLKFYKPAGSLSGTTPTADAATSKSFYLTLAGATTFTFANFNDGDAIVVRCQQAASGGPYTVAFPSATWQGGSQPVQTATANKSDIYQFHKQATTIYANAIQNF